VLIIAGERKASGRDADAPYDCFAPEEAYAGWLIRHAAAKSKILLIIRAAYA